AAAREVARDLARRLDWSLPWAPLGRLPAKTSVTKLKWVAGGRTVDGVDVAEAAGDEEPAAPWPAGGWQAEPPRGHREDPASTPAADARWRGTIVHRVIQQLDLSRPLDARGLREQLDELAARQVLAPDQLALVPVHALAAFFAGPLGQRMRAARDLRREVPFLLRLPAGEVHGAGSFRQEQGDGAPVQGHSAGASPAGAALLAGEWVLVQGVVDALWREGDGLVVVDFKTDRVTGDPAALAVERGYDRQLRLYARATTAAYGRPVTEACT